MPSLDVDWTGTYSWKTYIKPVRLNAVSTYLVPARVAAFVAVICLWTVHMAAADDQAMLLRVFLKDGTSLVSYGEPARVDNRVVFSMPTSSSVNDPQLQLINLSIDHIDWERTDRYSQTARSARYMATQAEAHYAMLTAEVGQALNDISQTTEALKRL